jgi:type II secretory ATPase GspE/PulE/Tfp pilus assembly ATPase PilB-like protein
VATQDQVRQILDEYCLELKHTDAWKRDPKGSYETIFRDWTKSFADEKGLITLYSPTGCEVCSGSGYKGRVGLHELLLGTDTVKRQVQEKARVSDLLATGLNEGMRTLKQDGIEKVLQGITDLHQVRAVCIK